MSTDLKTALLELANAPDKRSTTSRVAEHFAEIENAFHSGVSRTAILETLNRHGISISLKTFDNVLYRLRKKQASDPVTSKKVSVINSSIKTRGETSNRELSRPVRDLSPSPPKTSAVNCRMTG